MSASSPPSVDAVIVGAGLAGLASALRLTELGRSVHLIEARTERLYPCNTRYSGGVFHVAFRSVYEAPEVLVAAVGERTEDFVHTDIAEALAANSARAIAWLEAQGVTFARMEPDEGWKDCILAPLGFHDGTRLVWRDLGADRMMQVLEAALEDRGVVIERGVRATFLTLESGHVRGVVAQRGDDTIEIPAAAVVLADGGFQGSNELLRRFVTPTPEALIQRGPGTSTGDGLRMAEAVGAELVGLAAFYGHVLSADALGNDDLWPFPFLDFLAEAGILVDSDARRFVDEGRAGVYMANAVARHAGGKPVFAVFDEAIWQEGGRQFFAPPNPNLLDAGGTLHRAPDLETLARAAGLPAEAFAAAVALHNEAVEADRIDTLSPARSDPKGKARAIRHPPFYAAPGRAAITHTMGGVRIDASARVRRPDGSPIGGLFAAGNVTGGFEGGPAIGYIGGLARALVFGLLAAETIRQDHDGRERGSG